MDKAAIQKLFDLARISVTAEELERFPQEMDAILAYVASLGALDVGSIPPILSMAPVENNFREDTSSACNKDEIKAIASQFPESKDGYLRTKNVFKKD